MFFKFLSQIIYLGTDKVEDFGRKNDIFLLNIASVLGALVCLITYLISLYSSSNSSYQLLNLFTGIICLLPLLFNYKGWMILSAGVVSFLIPATMIGYTYLFGNIGADYYLFVGIMIAIYFYRRYKLGVVVAVVVNGIGFIFCKYLLIQQQSLRVEGIGEVLFFPNIILALSMMGILTHLFRKHQELQTEQISKHKDSQGKLISVLSHDLKSPLNNLQMLIHELKSSRGNVERQDIVMSMAVDSLKNTGLLIDNVVHWINRDNHKLQARNELIVVNDVLAQVINLYKPIAQRRSIEIVNVASRTFEALGDEQIVRMILRNLLSNAIKFTYDENKIIELMIQQDQNKIWVGVKDEGIGLETHELEILNAKDVNNHQRISSGSSTGMGLILVKYFVNLMNSELKVESQKGQGTFISFSLPKA